jgi:uncharacterized protein involved in exopolysaccharide biosynthesis
VNKSTSYRETFHRHRVLLILPVVLATLIAAWIVLSTPKTYQSVVSLWVDMRASGESSLTGGAPGSLSPSQLEQQVLTELLATRDFRLAVAQKSMLGHYLAKHDSAGFAPMALLSGRGSLETRTLDALTPKVVQTVLPGPQVLQISYNGPTPDVAKDTLRAIVAQLQQDGKRLSQESGADAVTYARNQVQTAMQAVAAARDRVNVYRSQHPSAGTNDPALAALSGGEQSAAQQLTQAQSTLSVATAAAQGAGSFFVRVLDSPTSPTGPLAGKRKAMIGIGGGLMAGVLISFLGMVALTRGKGERWVDESVEEAPAASVVAELGGSAAPVVDERPVAVASSSESGATIQRRFVYGPQGDVMLRDDPGAA